MMRAEDQGGMSGDGASSILSVLSPKNFIAKVTNLNRRLQHYIDITAPFTLERWGVTGALLFLFMLRVILMHGWYLSLIHI